MSMDEDAMYKALLRNKPQQQKAQAPVTAEVKEPNPVFQPVKQPLSTTRNSEDAMYKALLRNRPQQQTVVQKVPVRTDSGQHAVQPVAYEKEHVAETAVTPAVAPEVDSTAESINNLTASVNMVYGLLKTGVAVLVLILVVGIAVLIKL